jgi:polyphosphate kinase
VAAAGRPGRIIAKMNALVDPQVIEALYRASRAGVQIDLLIRGLCALRPGIPGVSENIRVRSIVGRFLEHSRVFYFANDGDADLYLASADWMERNFFRRVEIAFPVREQTHRDRILRDLNYYIADNVQAWTLGRDGTYTRCQRGEEPVRDAQASLLGRYAAGSTPIAIP